MVDKDLFGADVVKDALLRDKFIEPPFSILDTKTKSWQNRKALWKRKGIKSEVGREVKLYNTSEWIKEKGLTGLAEYLPDGSIFDPVLCEILYHWFCFPGGEILDPFAGGSVRGIVANYLGYKYTGIDIRKEQIVSNYEQSAVLLSVDNQPLWLTGDSNDVLESELTAIGKN